MIFGIGVGSFGQAGDAPLVRLRVAITSISGTMAPPWAAHEAGIFRKHGLQVEVIATPSGIQGTNALIAGEVSFLQIAGGTHHESPLQISPHLGQRLARGIL
jgi:ABC-type nitrate/sulfonate/bicarbonate transport system substrate-binding protein